MSTLFSLNSRDFIKGGVVAVLGAVLTLLLELFQHGLSLTSADYEKILQVAIITAIGYLLKNLLSDEQGKVLGRI